MLHGPLIATRLGAGGALWSPLQLGSALVAWWDPSQGITDDGGGLVSAWADRIGGQTVTATGTARPTFSTTALDGYPGLTFDGTDDALALATPTGFPQTNASGALFAVSRQDALAADTTTRTVIGHAHVSPRRLNRGVVTGVNRARLLLASNLTDTVTDLSGACVMMGQLDGDGTTARGFINGAAFSPATATVAPNTGNERVRIGAASGTSADGWWVGVIGHCLVVSGVLPQEDRDRLFGWAAWEINRADLLPSGHPYKSRRP